MGSYTDLQALQSSLESRLNNSHCKYQKHYSIFGPRFVNCRRLITYTTVSKLRLLSRVANLNSFFGDNRVTLQTLVTRFRRASDSQRNHAQRERLIARPWRCRHLSCCELILLLLERRESMEKLLCFSIPLLSDIRYGTFRAVNKAASLIRRQ